MKNKKQYSKKVKKKFSKHILVFNVGSSSVKAALYEGKKECLRLNIERVKTPQQRKRAVAMVARSINLAGFKLSCIAHRIVHGGFIKKHCVITPPIFKKLQKISTLAPLHNIPELEVVSYCKKEFGVKQIAIFDTAFHSTMSDVTCAYALPYSFFKEGFKKYGFHGISHQYITSGLRGKVISCHLGNGCSVTAVNNGKSVDTSMGFTPLEGLVMGTRSGSIDPGLLLYLMDEKKYSVKQMKELLNRQSGLIGLSGISSDMRDLLKLKNKNKRAMFAIQVYCYSIAKTIGAYASVLNGVNTIVFTGGIGQNSHFVRSQICKNLGYLGLSLDAKANMNNKLIVSSKKSRVRVLAKPTNEEIAMVLIAQKFV